MDVEITNGKLRKWSLARCQNVNYLYSLFTNDHTLIERMDDKPHLPALVLMREDRLKSLLAPIEGNDLLMEIVEVILNQPELNGSSIRRLLRAALKQSNLRNSEKV